MSKSNRTALKNTLIAMLHEARPEDFESLGALMRHHKVMTDTDTRTHEGKALLAALEDFRRSSHTLASALRLNRAQRASLRFTQYTGRNIDDD